MAHQSPPTTKPNGFTALDTHFAALLMRLASMPSPGLELAARLASRWRALGHLCVDLGEVVESPPGELGENPVPKLNVWLGELRASGVVGAPGEFAPLVLDSKGRLYLWRYWNYERTLAGRILRRVNDSAPTVDSDALDAGLDRLFPRSGNATDWQRVAAETAATRNFCVISGGPGTGKTRTVASILALLIEQGATRLALAAPTGKAAARLKESLRKGKRQLACGDEVKAALPDDVTTIHRLLGARPGSATYLRNAGNPLDVDAVVVDEASMVDVPLMAKLFDATPDTARIVLLGDRNQLASVEAGHALGDICGTGAPESGSAPPIAKAVVELRRNYRFGEESGIARLGAAVNSGDAETALALLRDETLPEIRWKALPAPRALEPTLRATVLAGYRSYLEADTPAEALARFDDLRILCAVREGPSGLRRLNAGIERILQDAALIDPRERWYRGRPVMVTRNDHNLKLYNGDIGLLLPDDDAGGELRAFFASDGEVRRFLPSRLPPLETVFATTVHKSQGSEFRDVLLVLPGNDSPVLTRELIYTGLTRARASVEMWGGEAVIRTAIGRRVRRSSGLREALWG